MTEPVYTATIPAYSHGGRFRPDPPAFHVVHSTEGPMSPGNAKALAGPAWFGGPKAGTSATDIFDPIDGVKMLDEHTVPYHVGPEGNGLSTGSEHCGSVNLTTEQWLSAPGRAMLDRSARRAAQRAHERGWSLADCRWLSVSEVAQKTVLGFCTHNDIRLALGGTTHSDPGKNFPYAWYIERVRFWFVNPNGEGELSMADVDDILKAVADVKATVNHQAAMLMFGESRDATKADVHPDSLQTLNTKLSKFIAESTARESALVAAVSKLAEAQGSPISVDEIKQTLSDAVEQGFADLDLRLVSGDPTAVTVSDG